MDNQKQKKKKSVMDTLSATMVLVLIALLRVFVGYTYLSLKNGYTLDDLTRAAIPLMDSGKQPELLQLIRSFGVEALPSLQPEQYGAFATALRGMGAQI